MLLSPLRETKDHKETYAVHTKCLLTFITIFAKVQYMQ